MDAGAEATEADEEWVTCRLCGPDLAKCHRECPRAAGAMTEADTRLLLDLLNGTPRRGFWPASGDPDGFTEHFVSGWTIGAYWNHAGNDWRRIAYVVAPDGARYEAYSEPGQRALPMDIEHWKPTWRLRYDAAGKTRIDAPLFGRWMF